MREFEFKKLVLQHKDRVFRYALYLLGNREDAEDVTQEAFLRLWKHAEPAAIQSTEAWLLRVTHNLCHDRLRRRSFENRNFAALEELVAGGHDPTAGAAESNPETELQRRELERRVLQEITALPQSQRAAMLLRQVEGLAYQEIAEVLGLPLSNVKVNIHRARQTLRRRLKSFFQLPHGAKS